MPVPDDVADAATRRPGRPSSGRASIRVTSSPRPTSRWASVSPSTPPPMTAQRGHQLGGPSSVTTPSAHGDSGGRTTAHASVVDVGQGAVDGAQERLAAPARRRPTVRAGWPTTRWKSGTDRVTTAPMPTIAKRPSSMPGPIVARAPIGRAASDQRRRGCARRASDGRSSARSAGRRARVAVVREGRAGARSSRRPRS